MATSPVFDAAGYYSENLFFDKALEEYERILGDSIGTDLEPTARLVLADQYREAASHRPKDEAHVASLRAKYEEQLDQVVQRFPSTTYAFVAKVMRFETLNETGSKTALDPALVAVGARPVAEILDDEPDSPFHERMIPEEYRNHVAEAYGNLSTSLSEEEQAKMSIFLHESFPHSRWWIGGILDYFDSKVRVPAMSYDGLPPGMPTEPDSVAPRILSRFPEPDQRTGFQPEIRVTLVDGDKWASQPSSGNSRLRLDGVDVTDFSFWKVRFDTTGTEPNFQELTIIYTPLLPLLPGQHTLEIVAADNGTNLQIYNWTFIVDPSGGAPTSETRTSTKDALVYEKNPHSNEGANPILTLEKINGKASRNLLGFDLLGVNTNSLTSATLALSIDPSDQVSGWGNGETVSVKPVTVAWQEGNGKKFGLPGSQQTAGSGAGTTWFSPTDENIANTSSNGVVQWNGAATYATTGTAPALTVRNNQTGELRFDVTEDVLNGVTHGWLLRKDAENKGSKVSFYSREGGGASLGPRLILEYGGQTAMSGPGKVASAVAAFFGFKGRPMVLQASAGVSEGPKGLGEFLRGSQRAAFFGEQVLLGFAGYHPLTQLGARVAYRSWLRETPSLV